MPPNTAHMANSEGTISSQLPQISYTMAEYCDNVRRAELNVVRLGTDMTILPSTASLAFLFGTSFLLSICPRVGRHATFHLPWLTLYVKRIIMNENISMWSMQSYTCGILNRDTLGGRHVLARIPIVSSWHGRWLRPLPKRIYKGRHILHSLRQYCSSQINHDFHAADTLLWYRLKIVEA